MCFYATQQYSNTEVSYLMLSCLKTSYDLSPDVTSSWPETALMPLTHHELLTHMWSLVTRGDLRSYQLIGHKWQWRPATTCCLRVAMLTRLPDSHLIHNKADQAALQVGPPFCCGTLQLIGLPSICQVRPTSFTDREGPWDVRAWSSPRFSSGVRHRWKDKSSESLSCPSSYVTILG